MTISRDQVDALIEKWSDISSCAEDRAERTLADEVVEDLTELRRGL